MIGEVATFATPNNQLVGTPNQDECVAFGCATIYYSGPPNGVPSGTGDQIRQSANYWYARETGDPASSAGLNVPQEYDILRGLGLKFVGLPIDGNSTHSSDVANVEHWLNQGVPVLICGVEDDFFDVLDGDQIPYGWRINANHCIVASGISPDGNWYVRDYLNVSLPGVVPGSRRIYDKSKMFLISGTAVFPRWYQGVSMALPAGAHDDGTTITFSNGTHMVMGFRAKYLELCNAGAVPGDDMALENEHASNPVEESNPAWWNGAGTAQVTRYYRFGYTSAKGVHVTFIGQEFLYILADRAKLKAQVAALAGLQQVISDGEKLITELKALLPA